MAQCLRSEAGFCRPKIYELGPTHQRPGRGSHQAAEGVPSLAPVLMSGEGAFSPCGFPFEFKSKYQSISKALLNHVRGKAQQMRRPFLLALSLCASSALSSCYGGEAEVIEVDTRDPLVEQALGDQLMVDPDLASQNEANAALTVAFDSSFPPLITGPEQRAAALTATRSLLLEGGEITDLPKTDASDDSADFPNLTGALTAAERASRIGFAKECADRLNYSAIWAARLPTHANIVPDGAVIEAAGNPQAECNIRIVTYVTNLPLEEVMQFHFNLAKRANLAPRYSAGDESVLHAISSQTSIAVHARQRSEFQTEVDVISREYAKK